MFWCYEQTNQPSHLITSRMHLSQHVTSLDGEDDFGFQHIDWFAAIIPVDNDRSLAFLFMVRIRKLSKGHQLCNGLEDHTQLQASTLANLL